MLHNANLAENLGVLATIDPATVNTAAGTVFSDVVAMADVTDLMAIVTLGDMAAADVVVTIVPCDANGSNAATALKTVTAASGSNDNTQVVLVLNNNDLAGHAKAHVKVGVAHADAAGGPVAAVVLGRTKHGPASGLASVTVA